MKISWLKAKMLLLFICVSYPASGVCDVIPSPSGQEFFFTDSSVSAETNIAPSQMIPVGIGPIATGGNSLTISVSLDQFANPVDIYLGFLLPDPSTGILLVNRDGFLQNIDEGLVPWLSNVDEPVNRILFENIPTSSLAVGEYNVYLMVTPAGTLADELSDYYLWQSRFTNSDSISSGYDYGFFIEYNIKESVQLSCEYPCATSVVPVIKLNIEGGFNILNNEVTGTGTISAKYVAPCTIIEQGGGGEGSSCVISGSTTGTFSIDGYTKEVTSVTGYGFQPTVELTFTEETHLELDGIYYLINPATGVATQLSLTYHAAAFSALFEASELYGTPFEIPTVVCDGWMDQTLEAAISAAFGSTITIPGAPGMIRTLTGNGQLFFYKAPFHVAGQ